MIDYKISEERYDDAGNLIYQKVRFYSGQIVQQTSVHPITGLDVTNDVYVRDGLLEEREYQYE